jgi:hypothetical protein
MWAESWFRTLHGQEIVSYSLFSGLSRPAIWPSHPPLCTWDISLGVKWPGCEVDHPYLMPRLIVELYLSSSICSGRVCGLIMCGCFGNMYTVPWVFFNLRFFLPWLRFFLAFFLSCKANARVKLAKTGHGSHFSALVVICVVLCIVCV